jgi:hypothetical protein
MTELSRLIGCDWAFASNTKRDPSSGLKASGPECGTVTHAMEHEGGGALDISVIRRIAEHHVEAGIGPNLSQPMKLFAMVTV